jgi:hypothetical protein
MTDAVIDLARTHLSAVEHLPYPQQIRPSAWWGNKAARVKEVIDGFDRTVDAVAYAQLGKRSGFDHRMRHDDPTTAAVTRFKIRTIETAFPGFFFADHPELRESPLSVTDSLVRIDDVPYSTIFLTHLYFCLRASETRGRERPIRDILEIGGGYGGLARISRLLHPRARYWIVDLPTSLFFAELFLRESFPDARFHYVSEHGLAGADDADFVLVPSQLASAVHGCAFDIALNTGSLQEMTQSSVDYWMDLLQNHVDTDFFYSCNYFLMNKRMFDETRDLAINQMCPVLDDFWDTRYFAINPPTVTVDAPERNWLEVCVRRADPEARRAIDQRQAARRLLDNAQHFEPGSTFWFADMWSALWHAADPDIVLAMLDGIGRFADGRGAPNNVAGEPGQAAHEMGEWLYYRSLIR